MTFFFIYFVYTNAFSVFDLWQLCTFHGGGCASIESAMCTNLMLGYTDPWWSEAVLHEASHGFEAKHYHSLNKK